MPMVNSMIMEIKMAKEDPIEKALKAKADYKTFRDEAIKALLEKRKEIDKQLADFDYREEKKSEPKGEKRQVTCSNCGEKGHTTRTCQNPDK
jgi:hypothetical protein